ncbi:restriction endonuclease subunit S [Flavobacterium psychrophilum]
METHKPKLRFPEFNEDWIKKTLKDVSTKVNSGKTPLGGEKIYTANGVLFIRSQNVNNDKLDLKNISYIPEKINFTMKNSIVLPNDILLNITGASLGRSCVVPIDFSIGNVNQHVCILRLNENYNPYFIQPIFSSQKGQDIFVSFQTGGGREGLNFDSIKKIELFFPNIKEQTRIANFLSSVDEKINLLKEKKSLLEDYKKGIMQKLFNQEIRFKDDNGNDFEKWQEKRLSEVSTKNSSNVSANKIEDNFGEYIIYGASGVLKKVDFYLQENDYISIIKDGAGVGRIFYCLGKTSVLGTMEMIKPNEGIHTYFLYCLLNNIDFTTFITGSTIPHIYFKDYSKVKCGIPCFKEQIKIANFLSAIDKKIELVSNQILDTQEYKKGLLQQMFV